ncbi:MAG: AAA family ATPase, partial [Candidatus Babeliales bacterium]
MKYLSKYARFIVVLVLMGHHGYCANNNNGSNILVDAINTTGEVTERIVTNLANNAAQAIKEGQARRSTLAQEVRNLSNQHYSYFYGWSQQRHKDDYDKKIEEMAQIDQNKKDARSFLSDTVVKGGLELMKQKTLGDAEVKAAVAKAAVDNQGALDRLNKLLEPENLKRFAVYGSLAIGLGAGAYYGVKFGYNYAESLVGKPSLVREWSYHDLKSRIKDYFYYTLLGNKRPVVENLNSLVFSPAIDAEIRRIVPEIKNNLALGLPLQNYAFYGPPGTGKTETARAIARECGLNYIIISTPDLDQFKGGDRVFEFNKLFNVIEGDHNWVWDIVEFSSNDKNDGPFLVFFDESDTGFRDRATLDKDAIAVVNT